MEIVDNDMILALSSLVLFDTLVTLFLLTVSLDAESVKAFVVVTMHFCIFVGRTLCSCVIAVQRPLMF